VFLDKGPTDRVRKGKGRKGKTFFTQGKNLVRGIDIKLGFSWTTLQDPLDQDKGRGILPFLMVGNLMWREGNPITFRYLQFNSEVDSLFGRTQHIWNAVIYPRFQTDKGKGLEVLLNLLPK